MVDPDNEERLLKIPPRVVSEIKAEALEEAMQASSIDHLPECQRYFPDETPEGPCQVCEALRTCEERVRTRYMDAMEKEGAAYMSGLEWGNADAMYRVRDSLENLYSKSWCGAGYVSCTDSSHVCQERRDVMSSIGSLDRRDFKDSASLLYEWFNSFDDDPNFSDYLLLVEMCKNRIRQDAILEFYSSETEAMKEMDRTWNVALDHAMSEVARLIPKPGAYEEHYMKAIKSLKRPETW